MMKSMMRKTTAGTLVIDRIIGARPRTMPVECGEALWMIQTRPNRKRSCHQQERSRTDVVVRGRTATAPATARRARDPYCRPCLRKRRFLPSLQLAWRKLHTSPSLLMDKDIGHTLRILPSKAPFHSRTRRASPLRRCHPRVPRRRHRPKTPRSTFRSRLHHPRPRF